MGGGESSWLIQLVLNAGYGCKLMGNEPGKVGQDQIVKDIESLRKSLDFIWQVTAISDWENITWRSRRSELHPRREGTLEWGRGWFVKYGLVITQGQVS